MTRTINAVVAASLSAVLLMAAGTSASAQDSRQRDKNNMRNLGMVLGAAAAHQAIKGKTPNALVLGAGAAYSAKKYEDARKAQSKEDNWRGRYDDDRRLSDYARRSEDARWRDRRDAEARRVSQARYYKKDNGRHLGHYKNGKKSRNCR